MRKILHSRVAAVSVGAAVLVGFGASGAVAANMIGSDDIRNGSVRAADIARGAIGSAEIENNSVDAQDVVRNSIGHSELKPNSVGVDQLSGWASSRVGDVNGLRHQVDALAAGAAGDYRVFTTTQDFGPGGIGAAWCGAPDANKEDAGWVVLGGGAQLSSEDVNAGVSVVSSWPNWNDPLNPGWNVQLNKPANVDPGEVALFAVCAKMGMAETAQ